MFCLKIAKDCVQANWFICAGTTHDSFDWMYLVVFPLNMYPWSAIKTVNSRTFPRVLFKFYTYIFAHLVISNFLNDILGKK